MIDENGKKLEDKEILKGALDHMAEALGHLFETKSTLCQSLAFSLDSLIKLGTVIYHDDDILNASCNWEKYEDELYNKKRLKLVK